MDGLRISRKHMLSLTAVIAWDSVARLLDPSLASGGRRSCAKSMLTPGSC